MTRVIHTGDTHIGYRQYHSAERRADFLAAFRSVVSDAIEDDVDALVHAGDLFHSRRPDLTDLLGVIEILRDLQRADIPFLAIVGNHDRTHGNQWLDLLSNLGLATRLDRSGHAIDDVTFYGLDYIPRSRRDSISYDFASASTDFTALVAHGLFEPFSHADWDTATLLSRATVDFDALLLGDNHKPDRAKVDDTWVTYCGSTERTSASERSDRGYNIVRFDDGVAISRRTISDTRKFEFIDVDLAEGEGTERILDRIAETDLEGAVGIVTITGDGRSIKPAEIEARAREAGALVARVNDIRDQPEETETSVEFADPDSAVRERIRESGLSDIGRSTDELIRDEGVADSNVRDRVTERVRSALEDGQIDRFRPLDGDESNSDIASEELGDESAKCGSDDAAAEEARSESENTADDPSHAESAIGANEPPNDGPPIDTDPEHEGNTEGGGQTSMEEYL